MGATSEQGSGANNWEKQPHKVNLATYSIGQTEVTQELWCAIKGNNPCDSPSDLKLPIGGVNWDACQVFFTIGVFIYVWLSIEVQCSTHCQSVCCDVFWTLLDNNK